ncbi:cation:proton antiporter [Trichothermofontia sichuanensis B231]|nr:cation:proton antiporter [Trichothermofontia sichuanensis]UZQ56294.1 cation:proton antiporter [Trichothermofontia sichuanensis B231]
MEQLTHWLPSSPLLTFTILLLVSLMLPPLFERFRLPGLVGLLFAGMLLGPDGLKLLDPNADVMKLLSDIGKIYLMFVAGMEIDLAEFRKTRHRSLSFGIATFLIPLIGGTLVGQAFGMGLNTSVLIGSLLASHTLLAYPIVNRLEVVHTEAVAITVGATIITDIAALLVLAICISIHVGEFSTAGLIAQLLSLAAYVGFVLVGFDWAGRAFFRRSGDQEGNQFLFVLLAVFLASVGAQLINIEQIVGAFLAGLAVNDVVGRGPVEEKIKFVGSTLFIPFFFVGMGLLLSVSGFISTLTTDLLLTLAIVATLIGTKFLAALVIKLRYGYHWNETLTMWSLSLPQVAATLAAALAALNVGLIAPSVFKAVIVLMLVTSILGPVLTNRFARTLAVPKTPLAKDFLAKDHSSRIGGDVVVPVYNPVLEPAGLEGEASDLVNSGAYACPLFRVVVPVYNPVTERYLIEMGALLTRHEGGELIPLAITRSHMHMDEPELDAALQRSHKLLQRAIAVCHEFQVKATPLVRIDDDVAHGISRAAREREASLIIMGWSPRVGLRARLFGTVIDSVFWSAHCPVAVVRLLEEPINIHQILVPIKALTPAELRTLRFAHLFANTNQASITLLHVCDRQTPRQEIARFEAELGAANAAIPSQVRVELYTLASDDVAQTILKTSLDHDIVMLRSVRRRTAAGLTVSDVTTQVIQSIKCSIVLLGEPQTGR